MVNEQQWFVVLILKHVTIARESMCCNVVRETIQILGAMAEFAQGNNHQ